MSNVLQIQRFILPTASWTALTAPITCSGVSIENTDTSIDLTFRTDASTGDTAKTIPAGTELSISTVDGAIAAGAVVGYLKPASGTPTVAVGWIR